MGCAERSVPLQKIQKRKRKNVSNVLIKLILKNPSNYPPLPSNSPSWDVPKGPFLQKIKRKNASNVLIKLILKNPSNYPPLPSNSPSWDVPKSPFLQKIKRK